MSRIDEALHRAQSPCAVPRRERADNADRLDLAGLFNPPADEPQAGEPPTELQAMLAVGEALRALPDDEARMRVLMWALKACGATTASAEPVVTAPGASTHTDDTLEVGDLAGLFDQQRSEPPPQQPPTPRAPAPVQSQSVESMIRGFVVEFQELAREWGSADA